MSTCFLLVDRNIDPGDLTDQRAIRTRLKCKSFKWFVTNVAFDLLKHYPAVEPPVAASGEIRNQGTNTLCIDTKFKSTTGDTFGLEPCIKEHGGNGEQQFEFTWHKDIRPAKRSICFDVPNGDNGSPVILYPCHGQKGNQHFKVLCCVIFVVVVVCVLTCVVRIDFVPAQSIHQSN